MIRPLLPVIWACLAAFSVLMYVVLDGLDLGVGILFPWLRSPLHRDTMMNSIGPVWDGNETWLVFGAACLYGAFPFVYSTLLPILYMPIILMLGALIFRGVAFEFRFRAYRSRFVWDHAFIVGSVAATFCQGVILGTFIQGFDENVFAGTPEFSVHWFTPFTMMTGIALLAGYALLGATWLIMKTTGELQREMFHVAKVLLILISLFIMIVSIWSPFLNNDIMYRWFTLPHFFYLLPLPILTMGLIIYTFRYLQQRHERWPFWLVVGIFILAYAGFGISMWPYLIPYHLDIWQAASNEKSLRFLLAGVIIMLPVLLAYSAYAYYVFKGKTGPMDIYHDD